jgi:hypothetical protein
MHPQSKVSTMYRTADPFARDETKRRAGFEEIPLDYRRGVELAPKTLESLVTWDVSGHAQCEKDRMNSLYRRRGAMQGGY